MLQRLAGIVRHRAQTIAVAAALGTSLFVTGCAGSTGGGGQANFVGPRGVNPADIVLPKGFRIDVVATGLDFPTGVAFDSAGQVYVVEAGYSYGEVWSRPRLLRIEPEGEPTVIATGENPPWNGVDYQDGVFYISEGGHRTGGRILSVGLGQRNKVLVDHLPSLGDHHTNGPVIGRDGWLYFGQGSATNSGVVGPDAAQFGWLFDQPDFHDIPAHDITLTGQNFTSDNPITEDPADQAITGAYSAFGSATEPGQVIKGSDHCNGAILRVRLSDNALEVFAWGLRNPFGLAFSPTGTLYATDSSYDARGSRPISGAGDLLWSIEPDLWYGWPDFHGDQPLSGNRRFAADGAPPPVNLLAEHPNTPPKPAATLAEHATACGLDFSRTDAFGFDGEAFIAQFGDLAPLSGSISNPAGFNVVRVNASTGAAKVFAENKGKGPASKIGGGGFERPIAVRFDPAGTALYIVDFGVVTTESGAHPRPETGVLWRITRVQ